MKDWTATLVSTLALLASFAPPASAQIWPPVQVSFATAPGSAVFQKGTAGVGPFLNVIDDLGAKSDFSGNSWWATGYFTSNGHKLSYIYHLLLLNSPTGAVLSQQVSVTDATTGVYHADSQVVPLAAANVGSTGLNIVTPTGSIQGDFDDLHVVGSMQGGNFNLHMRAASSALFNGGTGIFPLLGLQIHEYSVPVLATTGSITIDSNSYPVQGTSWFDRQWQNQDPALAVKWAWIGINLDNGDALSVWSAMDATIGKQRSWATILHADGSQTAVAAQSTFDPVDLYTSPVSGSGFPVSWTVQIPVLKTSLKVVASPRNQEIVSAVIGDFYEGASNVLGIYKGLPVAGAARIELLGVWP